ncbi:MAG: ACT domain-containing protein [Clostridia bacterium]|nr:ACT domain-containing protein [Clostridia bacterium]
MSDMRDTVSHYIVSESALPKVLKDVAKLNSLLERGEVKTVAQGLELVGISRSAYYKYRDKIAPFHEIRGGSSFTLYVELKDEPGVLSQLLEVFARCGMNILTISQNIPINSVAGITITARATGAPADISDFTKQAEAIKGLKKLEILAG